MRRSLERLAHKLQVGHDAASEPGERAPCGEPPPGRNCDELASVAVGLLAGAYLFVGEVVWRPLLVGDADLECTDAYQAPAEIVGGVMFFIALAALVAATQSSGPRRMENRFRFALAAALMFIAAIAVFAAYQSTGLDQQCA